MMCCDKVKKWLVPGTGDLFTQKNHLNRFPAIFQSEMIMGTKSRRYFQVKKSPGLYSGGIFKSKYHRDSIPAIFSSQNIIGTPFRQYFQVKISSGLHPGGLPREKR